MATLPHLLHGLPRWITGRNLVILVSLCSVERISSRVDQRNTFNFSEIDSLFSLSTLSLPIQAQPLPTQPDTTNTHVVLKGQTPVSQYFIPVNFIARTLF